MRVRASAGSSSFRRKPSLDQCLKTAEEHLEELKRQAAEDASEVYLPIWDAEKKREKGIAPYDPMDGDSEEVKRWRARMETAAAKEIYKQRTAKAEFPNAGCRNRGLTQLRVRGLLKVKAVSLWQALAHNFQRTIDLRKLHGLAFA